MTLTNLQDALRFRLQVIADHALRDADPAVHLQKLREASEGIEAVQAALWPSLPPRLRHFLESRSFDKALAEIDRLIAVAASPGQPSLQNS